MGLIQLKVEVAAAVAGEVDLVLQELAQPELGMLEDVDAGRAWIIGVFTDATEARRSWEDVKSRLESAGLAPAGEPAWEDLGDADWKLSYRAHFKAWKFGRLNWVPEWEREAFQAPAGELVVWMDPGMAFGTGNHETTRLCCERLVAYFEERGPAGRVIDAGCGSGILALSAARLGFSPVFAFDNDPLAIEVSRENAGLNGVTGRVEFQVSDLEAGLAGRQAELVLANIQADVLARHARQLCATVAPGGRLVLSGILRGDYPAVAKAFQSAAPGWTTSSTTMGEWCDVALDPPAANPPGDRG